MTTDAQAQTLVTEVLGIPSANAETTSLTLEVMVREGGGGSSLAETSTLVFEVAGFGTSDVAAHTTNALLEVAGNGPSDAQATEIVVEVMAGLLEQKFVKFHEKTALLYGKQQLHLGLAAPLNGTNAIAGLNVAFEDKITSSVAEFGESCVGRSAVVSTENITREITFATLFPTVSGTEILTENSLPLRDWLEACGGTFEFQQDSVNTLFFSNETPNNSVLSLDFQQIPENDTPYQNSYKVMDAVGTVGLELTIKKLAKLNFKFSGNPFLPTYEVRHIPDFGAQKLNILGPIKNQNLQLATLTDLETEKTTNLCFYKLQTDNLFGFDFSQIQSGCGDNVERVPKPGSVALTVALSPRNSVDFLTPEYCVGRRYSMVLQFGSSQYPITLELTELQMADYKRLSFNGLVGLAIGFINTGFTRLSFTGPAGN